MDIVKTTTDTVKKPFMLARAYPLAVALIAFIAMAIGVRKGAQWQADIKTSAAGGSTIGKALAWVFGVTLAVAFLLPLDAVAAVAHQAGQAVDGYTFGTIAKLIGGALAFGAVASYTKGAMIPHQFTSGNFRETLNPAGGVDAERTAVLTYSADRVGDKPLKATEVGLMVRFRDTATDGAVDVSYENFGGLISFVELDSPTLGLIADRNVCTGANLWNTIIPALRQGKRGMHTDKCVGHDGEGSTVTDAQFYLPIPFTDESGERPIDTARLIRELQGSLLRVQPNALPAPFGLGHAISNLTVELVTNTVLDMGEKPWQIGAILAFCRYSRKCALNQSEIQFDNVGMTGGPAASNATKGSRMVFACLPTSQFGQNGPVDTFGTLLRYGAPAVGQPDTVLVDTLAVGTVAAMDLNNGNDLQNLVPGVWPCDRPLQEADAVTLQYALSLFPVITTGARRKASQMRTLKENLTLNVQFTSSPENGQWYLMTIERRDLHANVVEALAKELGFDPNKARRATIDGNDPTGKILSDASGASRAHHRTLPVQLQ